MAIFGAIIVLIVIGFIYYFIPEPTCFDNRKNQDEEEADCGGSCIPCSKNIKDLTILWSRAFPVRDGIYDAAAFLENQNQFLETKEFTYAVKLYDKSNILIAIRENSTFILPGERFIIFEPNIATLNRVPAKAILETRSVKWVKKNPEPLKINVQKISKFIEDESTSPRVEAEVKNAGTEDYQNIEAVAILRSSSDEVLGVSKTILDNLNINEEKTLTFTWPNSILGVDKVEILLRRVPK